MMISSDMPHDDILCLWLSPKLSAKRDAFVFGMRQPHLFRGGKCHELCIAIVAHSDSAHCHFSPLGLQNLQEGRLEVVSFGPVFQGMFVSKLV